MEFDEQEDHQLQVEKERPSYDSSSQVIKLSTGSVGLERTTTTTATTNTNDDNITTSFSIKKHSGSRENSSGGRDGITRYRECLKNHAVGIGGHAIDGCGEFMPGGPDGSLDALKCAACGCHRNFHRKETTTTTTPAATTSSSAFQHHHHHGYQSHHHQHQLIQQQPAVYQFFPYNRTASPYLMATPVQQRPLALPSTSHHSRDDHDVDEVSNPSSGVGGAGGDAATVVVGSGYLGMSSSSSRKRFRTKFTAEQKERMGELAERLGWRIQRQDEDAVQRFCEENGVRRHVLKVWMHNNKHTLGKIMRSSTSSSLEHDQQEHREHPQSPPPA